jgi:hypothetical protein
MLFASLVSLSAQAGSVLKVDAKDSAGKIVPNEVFYAQGGMLRIDRVDASGNVTRYTLIRDGVIWEVDPQERTYTRVDSASLQQAMGGKDAQLQAMIARLPPEKRAAMEAKMAQIKQNAASTEYTFTDTGRTDHSGQYSCRVWQQERNSKPFAQYCVVPASSLPDGADLETSMKQAVATTNQILAGVPQLAKQAEHITLLGKMGGFPVNSRIGEGTEHVLTSAQAQSLPADKFAIPQGYTEKTLGAHRGD